MSSWSSSYGISSNPDTPGIKNITSLSSTLKKNTLESGGSQSGFEDKYILKDIQLGEVKDLLHFLLTLF
jgi:hypothetical protein